MFDIFQKLEEKFQRSKDYSNYRLQNNISFYSFLKDETVD